MLDKAKLPDLPQGPANALIADSIPVVCHYDSHTLLTKDGELVQTIEITGDVTNLATYNTVLRDEIRKAISETVKDFKIAVYFHTIRSRKNIMPKAEFKNEFASRLNDDWCKKNNFDKQLINTVYITFVYQGLSHSIVNVGNLLKSLVYPLIKKEQLAYLEESHAKLEAVTNQVLSKLGAQGARRLDLIQTDDGVISEQLVFYHHLVHLNPRKVMLETKDSSCVLAKETIKYNFNSLEIDNYDGKQYAAVFSIKDYYEISPSVLDQLLQMGFQYVLTQIMILETDKVATKEYKELADIGYLSKNEYINKVSGIKQLVDVGSDKAYCRQQTTITVFSDEFKFFESRVKQISKAFANLGIACIREDFNMASLFWGQLPGNLRFLTHGRFSYLDVARIGAYCTIFDKEVGNYQGSKWGAPISLLRSDKGTPFYFNFHNQSGFGHTLFVGPTGSGKTVISRFLITQALKTNPKILYIDFEGHSKEFIEAIGGKYLSDEEIRDKWKLNPFQLQSFKKKPSLFKDWLIDAVSPKAKEIPSYIEVFEAIANKIYEDVNLPNKTDAILKLLANLNDTTINQGAEAFFKNTFPKYLTEEKSSLSIFKKGSQIVGLDMSMLIKDKVAFKTYIGVFLESLLKNLDGTPTIIYINEFEAIYSVAHLKQVLYEWLRVLDEKNGIMIGNSTHQEEFEKDPDYQAMIEMLGTLIFLSDKSADKYFRRCYKLTDDELHKVKSYAPSRRMFLVKQDALHKMLLLNLEGIEEGLAILDTPDE